MDSIYARLIVRGRLAVASRTVNRPINCPYINKNFSAGVAPDPTQLKLAELENDSGDQRLMRPATMQEPPRPWNIVRATSAWTPMPRIYDSVETTEVTVEDIFVWFSSMLNQR